jgi:hypothetical protein
VVVTASDAPSFLCNASGYQAIPALSALNGYYASKQFPPHTVITMPAVSPTMTAGNIGTWQKEPGDELEDTGGANWSLAPYGRRSCLLSFY